MMITILCFLCVGKSFSSLIYPCEDVEEEFHTGNNTVQNCGHAQSNRAECEKNVFQVNCAATCNTCCVDHPALFDIAQGSAEPGKMRSCDMIKDKPHLCNKETVKKFCPMSCNLCPCRDERGIFDFNESQLTSCYSVRKFQVNCPSTCNTCCVDHPALFDIAQGSAEPGKMRSCDMIKDKPHLCNKETVKKFCPMSCNLCPCRDERGIFDFNESQLTSCYSVRKSPIRCRNQLFQEKCPCECVLS